MRLHDSDIANHGRLGRVHAGRETDWTSTRARSALALRLLLRRLRPRIPATSRRSLPASTAPTGGGSLLLLATRAGWLGSSFAEAELSVVFEPRVCPPWRTAQSPGTVTATGPERPSVPHFDSSRNLTRSAPSHSCACIAREVEGEFGCSHASANGRVLAASWPSPRAHWQGTLSLAPGLAWCSSTAAASRVYHVHKPAIGRREASSAVDRSPAAPSRCHGCAACGGL